MILRAVLVVSAILLFGLPQLVQAVPLVSSTFDLNGEGWGFVNDGTNLTFQATGGNPGGHISVTDLETGGIWRYLAPAKFLGNQSGAFHGTIGYDLSQTSGPGTVQFSSLADVVIVGTNGTVLTFDAGANPSQYPVWTSYTVPFDAAAGWKLRDGNAISVGNIVGDATQAQLLAVLSSLAALELTGEFTTGADVGRLDNVSLNPVPEPATVLLVTTTAAGLGLARWRQRRRTQGSLPQV